MNLELSIRDRVKELRRVRACDLVANPKNWRKHPPGQQKAMRAVLAEIGFADALLAREDENGRLVLIDGHLRAEMTPDMEVPVLILDVDANEADKILATLDPLAGLAELDMDAFKTLAAGIEFDVPEFGALLQQLQPSSVGSVEGEDEVPALPKVPTTRLGDLWILGPHRLLCGDSTKREDVDRLMQGQRAVLFATDPPYLVDYDGMNHPSKIGDNPKKNKDWSESYHEWDSSQGDGRQFYLDFCRLAKEVALADNAAWYCWHASRRQAMLESVWEELGAFVHQQIVWYKSRPVLTYSIYMWAHEPCLFGWVKGKRPLTIKPEQYPSTVWNIPSSEVESSDHPTSKPVRIFRLPMELHTRPGEICFEPFSGSGSQVIAAETSDRICYGLELSPQYVDVIVSRWQILTGKQATLDGDGRTFVELAELRGKH